MENMFHYGWKYSITFRLYLRKQENPKKQCVSGKQPLRFVNFHQLKTPKTRYFHLPF